MRRKKIKNAVCNCRGLTLLELVLAMAMVGIIFAAILPQFAVIRNSWDVKAGTAEALQNGRVLMEHISRNLSKAVLITAVSESSVSNGYIEFKDLDDNTLRYDIAANNYVEYGVADNLSDLAGPVDSLTFTCYDACDLDSPLSPVTDVNLIRTIKVDVVFTNSASMGRSMPFTTLLYLRTNGKSSPLISTDAAYDYAIRTQGTNIFAYKGNSSGGGIPLSDPSVPADSYIFNSGEYDKIEVDDGIYQMYASSQISRYALMRFKILIDESKSSVRNITVTWNGKGINLKSSSIDGAILFIWNYAAGIYQQLQQSADTEAEVVLTGTISSNISNYIGGPGENTITVLVSTADRRTGTDACELYTDYIKVDVSAQTGDEIRP
jgi:prepilin-type N-terminal cleavage/methylation domain-containing protein